MTKAEITITETDGGAVITDEGTEVLMAGQTAFEALKMLVAEFTNRQESLSHKRFQFGVERDAEKEEMGGE